jgi:hypothetical protein
VLLHQAAISAADVILQAAGLRVSGGDGSHQLRLTTAIERLDRDTGDLLERLDASRWARNEASYGAMPVAEASVEEAREATAELIALAAELVDSE